MDLNLAIDQKAYEAWKVFHAIETVGDLLTQAHLDDEITDEHIQDIGNLLVVLAERGSEIVNNGEGIANRIKEDIVA